MTTTAPPRSLDLPPVALSARPLRLHLPRFELAPTAPVAPLAPVAAAPPLPAPEVPTPAPQQPAPPVPLAQTTPLAQPTPVPQPTSIAPITATPSLTRRDGTIGLAIGILVMTLVLAAAFAMQRSMHGWPPGMH